MKKEKIAFDRGYRVSFEGEAMNKRGLKIGHVSNSGYMNIRIRIFGKMTNIHTHRIQAYQKYGEKIYDDEICVRHLNGNKLDNSHNNILIGTQSENMMDIPKEMRLRKALHATSYIKVHDHEKIRKFHKISKSYKKTMKKFKISSKGTLSYILNR